MVHLLSSIYSALLNQYNKDEADKLSMFGHTISVVNSAISDQPETPLLQYQAFI